MLGVWHHSFSLWSKLGHLIRPRTLWNQKNQYANAPKSSFCTMEVARSMWAQSLGYNLVPMVGIWAWTKEDTGLYLSCYVVIKLFTTCTEGSEQTPEYTPMRFTYAFWKWNLWEEAGYSDEVLKKKRQEASAITDPKQWWVILGLQRRQINS